MAKTNKGIARLQESLATSKWMITSAAFNTLVSNVTKAMETGVYPPPMGNNDTFIPNGETVSEAEDVDNVGIIYVHGILAKAPSIEEELLGGMLDIDYITNSLNAFADDASVSNIVLCFASPGGEVTGCEELGRLIKHIDENIKPVYAWTEIQASSAAYWLASQCRSIGMTPTATVGSIGVYSLIEDTTKAMENAGVKIIPISSGKYKLIGHNFRSLTEEEHKLLQEDVNKQHQKFKQVVLSKRPNVPEEAMEGLSYEGDAALANHLTDYVFDNINSYLEQISMKTEKVKINAKAEAKSFQELAKQELTGNVMKNASVPGVPGTEEAKKKAGHYDGGYQEEAETEKKAGSYDGQYQEENGHTDVKNPDDKHYEEHEVTCPHCNGKHTFKLETHEEPDGDEPEGYKKDTDHDSGKDKAFPKHSSKKVDKMDDDEAGQGHQEEEEEEETKKMTAMTWQEALGMPVAQENAFQKVLRASQFGKQ